MSNSSCARPVASGCWTEPVSVRAWLLGVREMQPASWARSSSGPVRDRTPRPWKQNEPPGVPLEALHAGQIVRGLGGSCLRVNRERVSRCGWERNKGDGAWQRRARGTAAQHAHSGSNECNAAAKLRAEQDVSDATACLTCDTAVGAGAAHCPLRRQTCHIHRWEGEEAGL